MLPSMFAYKSGLHRADHGNLRISDLQLIILWSLQGEMRDIRPTGLALVEIVDRTPVCGRLFGIKTHQPFCGVRSNNFPKHFPGQMKANLSRTEPRPEQTGCRLPESLCRLQRHPLRPAKLLRSAGPNISLWVHGLVIRKINNILIHEYDS